MFRTGPSLWLIISCPTIKNFTANQRLAAKSFILEFEVKHNGHKPNNNTTAFLQANREPYKKNNKKRKPGFTVQRQMDLRGGTNVRII